MEQSILKSTKKILGLDPANEAFDLDIITHINSAFSNLTDIGIGPENGFAIEDDESVWDDFLANDIVKVSQVKVVVCQRARLLFDPPTQAFLIEAIKSQIQEAEWRLSTNREDTDWTDPDPETLDTLVSE